MSLTFFVNIKKMFIYLMIFWICIMEKGIVEAVKVITVPVGSLAELPCLSMDENHIFMLWQLTNDKNVIGPGNPMDEEKYNYEVLTGKLFIREVSSAESGFYKCLARGVTDKASVKIHIIELLVTKGWEESYENDHEVNVLRAMAAIMVIVVSLAVFLFVIMMKQKRTHRFMDLEESRDSSPVKYIPDKYTPKYTPNTQSDPFAPSTSKVEPSTSSGLDNFGMEIDFPKVFQQMQSSTPVLS